MNPPPLPPAPGTFAARNWWRNGTACKVLVIGASLCLLNLVMPWKADFAGSVTQGDFVVWKEFRSTATAFHVGAGWILLPCLALILWVCGRPRAATRSIRWLPLICVIITFACAAEQGLKVKREMDNWVAGFRNVKPVVTLPAAVTWTCLLSVPMAAAAWFFGRSGRAEKP